MADIKVRVGQSDAVKVTSTGLRRSDIAFSVEGGTASVSQLNVSGISSLNNLNLSGIATFKPNTFGISGIIINGINETIEVGTGITLTSNSIEVDGSADFESLIVSGISTLNSSGGITTTGGDLFVGSDLFVKDTLEIEGTSLFSGITTFLNVTDNTLGNVNTGAVQLDGGLGVAKNVTVGGGLSVTGNSFFIGEVTFSSGTNGTISIGDSTGDNVVFNADVNSSFIPNINDTYDLGSNSQNWKNLFLSNDALIGRHLRVAGVSTYVGVATFKDDLFVDGILTAGLIDGGSF